MKQVCLLYRAVAEMRLLDAHAVARELGVPQRREVRRCQRAQSDRGGQRLLHANPIARKTAAH